MSKLENLANTIQKLVTKGVRNKFGESLSTTKLLGRC
jgi:hypothetical protein